MSVDELQVDLPAADPERVTAQLVSIFDISPDDVIHISAKTGFGVQGVIDAIISRIPAPTGSEALPLRARLFDSSYVECPFGPWAAFWIFWSSPSYDRFRGVISLLRIQDGVLKRGALRSTLKEMP
jgi:translation elongation factor EF-4